MYISEKTEQALLADGWQYASHSTLTMPIFEKLMPGIAESGTVSEGARVVQLRIDASGRWLERYDQGLSKVEKDCDLRRFDNVADAIKEVLS